MIRPVKFLLLFLFLLNFNNSRAQFPVKLYYDVYWRISPENFAHYKRETDWSYEENYFNGPFKDILIDSNIIVSEGNYSNHLKQGPFKLYYPDGSLKSKGKYVDDKKKGIWEYYSKDGTKTHEILHGKDTFSIMPIDLDSRSCFLFNRDYYTLVKQEAEGFKEIKLEFILRDGLKVGRWKLYIDDKKYIVEKYRRDQFKKAVRFESGRRTRVDTPLIPFVLANEIYLYRSEQLATDAQDFELNEYLFMESAPGKQMEYPYQGIVDDTICKDVIPPVYPEGYNAFRTFMDENIICYVPPETELEQHVHMTLYIDTTGQPYRYEFKEPLDEPCKEMVFQKIRKMNNWYPAATEQGELIPSKININLDITVLDSTVKITPE